MVSYYPGPAILWIVPLDDEFSIFKNLIELPIVGLIYPPNFYTVEYYAGPGLIF